MVEKPVLNSVLALGWTLTAQKSMFFSHNVTQKTGQLKKTCFHSHFENMENQNLGQILL